MSNKSEKQLPLLLFLVRHGLTETTGKILPGRQPGLSLNNQGIIQAQQIAEELIKAFENNLKLLAIYCSPLLRCRQTASYLSAKTSMKIIISSNLTECDFGEMTGKKLQDLAKEKDWQRLHTWPSAWRFPNGESFWEVRSRMLEFIEELRSKYSQGAIVAYSHADPIKIILSELLGSGLENFQKIQINPASVSIVELPNDVGRPRILTVNSCGAFEKLLEPIIKDRKK